MGHVFDCEVMEPGFLRGGFAAVVGRVWSSELFADAYALCWHNRRLRRTVRTGYGLVLRPAVFVRVCSLIRTA